MTDRFPICFPLTLAQESPDPKNWSDLRNYSNDKHDPGGQTFNGVVARDYDLWRKGHGLPTQDVRKMTQEEGQAIYRIGYWMPHCPNLPAGLDMQYFDAAVNMGSTEATKILQHALGVASDGDWGPLTSAAVTLASKDMMGRIEAFTLRRQAVYRQLKGFPYFGTDWLRRATEIGAEALKMAA